ncbi:putative holin-like toxin [Halalkalibacterium ligniniphilum]|nr:putative holin-like toxin [Halalkalibacterium ligniniphilum]
MTIYEVFSLLAQFSLVLTAILTLTITFVVYLNKKK